jgi:hypothetical protein
LKETIAQGNQRTLRQMSPAALQEITAKSAHLGPGDSARSIMARLAIMSIFVRALETA